MRKIKRLVDYQYTERMALLKYLKI